MGRNNHEKTDTQVSSQHEVKTMQVNNKRRWVLGGIAGASAIAWQTPIVKTMVLPAHAQTSGNNFFASIASVSPTTKLDKSFNPLDLLVEGAIAGDSVERTSEYSVSIQQSGSNQYDVQLFERILEGMTNVGEVLFGGTLQAGAAGTLGVLQDPCDVFARSISATIISISASEAVMTLNSRGEQLNIPPGTDTVPMPMCVDNGLPQSFFNAETEATDPMIRISKNSPLDFLIPEAHAGKGPIGKTFGLKADKIDESQYMVEFLNDAGDVLRSGTLMTDGTEGTVTITEDACVRNPRRATLTASILYVNSSEISMMTEC